MKLLFPLSVVAAAASCLIAERALGAEIDTQPSAASTLVSTVPAVEGATVKGQIQFKGEKPKVKPLVITEEQSKGCCAEGTAMETEDRSLRIGKNGGIQDCVVSITVEGKKPAPSKTPLLMDQKNCRFEPFILLAPAGSEILFKNSDKVTHNIHSHAFMNDPLNRAVGEGGDLTVKMEKAERVKMTCDYHPWMTSWVVVTDATYSAVTGADGSFELKGLEPGKYTVDIWHPTLGKAKTTVEVKADGTSEPIKVEMEKSKKSGRRKRRR